MKQKNFGPEFWFAVLTIVGTTILLCAQSIWNGFPLVYSDSGTYMIRSFSLEPPIDRPIGYSLFIRWVTWAASMWPVVVAQSLISSILIYFTTRKVLKPQSPNLVHLLICLVLVAFSSLGWYTNQIMPDIFISTLILAFFLFIHAEKLRWLPAIWLAILFFLFNFSHLSHVLISGALLGWYGLGAFWLRKKRPLFLKRIFRLGILAGVLVVSVLFLMFYNLAHDYGFKLSKTSSVFMTERLVEGGFLQEYLDENCPGEGSGLCAVREQIPEFQHQFLWDPGNPMEQLGLSLEQADSAFAQIPGRILSKPGNLFRFAGNSLLRTGKQCILLDLSDGPGGIYGEGTGPWWGLRAKPEVTAMLKSRQNTTGISFKWLNPMGYLVLAISLIVILLSLVLDRKNPALQKLLFLVLLSYFLNAFVLAALSTVTDRYQARISWLLVFVAILCLPGLVRKLRTQLENS